MRRHADLRVGIARRRHRAQTGHEGQRLAGDRDRVPAQLPDRQLALVARRRRGADQALVDPPVAARVLHRRADAVEPGALVRRLRRREGRARELLGIEPVIRPSAASSCRAARRPAAPRSRSCCRSRTCRRARWRCRATARRGSRRRRCPGRSWALSRMGCCPQGSGIATGWPLRVYKGCLEEETAHGTVPARRPAARDLGREPDGDRRLRVRRVLPSRSGRARPPVQGHGLLARGEAPLEGRDALPSGRRQLHPQRGAAILRGAVRGRARALGAGHGLPRRRRASAPTSARIAMGAKPAKTEVGPMELAHPGDRGHRRPADLSRRPLRGERLDLRRRLQLDRRTRPASARRRPALHRPPDPQRPSAGA